MRNWNMVCHGDCFMTWELEEIDVLAALAFAFLLYSCNFIQVRKPQDMGFHLFFWGVGWESSSVIVCHSLDTHPPKTCICHIRCQWSACSVESVPGAWAVDGVPLACMLLQGTYTYLVAERSRAVLECNSYLSCFALCAAQMLLLVPTLTQFGVGQTSMVHRTLLPAVLLKSQETI